MAALVPPAAVAALVPPAAAAALVPPAAALAAVVPPTALTVAETTAFFIERAQMGLSVGLQLALQTEGIINVDDLGEFDDDHFKEISNNLRNPANVPSAADANVFVRGINHIIPARSLMRLKVAAELVRFYQAVDRPLTALGMSQTVCSVFALQWKSIQDRKKETAGDVPRITKEFGVMKWAPVFTDYCFTIIGVRDVPIFYVLRSMVAVATPAPPRATNKPYSDSHGSVQDELISRVSFDHACFFDDRAKLYEMVEIAARNTKYAPTVAPYKATKDGRGAFYALVTQHAGTAKWEEIIKMANAQLRTMKFKGNNQLTLETHCNKHRTNFISLQEAGGFVPTEIPSARTRVTLLLDSIDCPDAFLLAQLAQVKANPALQEDFEGAVTLLLPSCPVAKKKGKTDANRQADISEVSIRFKQGFGVTGVEFRYYPTAEYKLLTDEQKAELNVWRHTEEGKADKAKGLAAAAKRKNPHSSNKNKKKQKRQISSAVAAEKKKNKKALAEVSVLVSSLAQQLSNTSPPLPPPSQPVVAGVSANMLQLQTIMRKFG